MNSENIQNQHNLVDFLIHENIIESQIVADTMRSIDRGLFCPDKPYQDRPVKIGYSATISAPHMHGYALEWLQNHLFSNGTALDIGSGSGYLTLCMSHMMNFTGKTIGIDHIPQIVQQSIININQYNPNLVENCIDFIVGDGRLGYREKGPYNAIHVGAASPVIPEVLIEQLASGGRMIIPVGERGSPQYITVVDKDLDGVLTMEKVLGVKYIPLTDREVQCP